MTVCGSPWEYDCVWQSMGVRLCVAVRGGELFGNTRRREYVKNGCRDSVKFSILTRTGGA